MPSEATHTHKHLKPHKHRERETDRDIMKRHSNLAYFDPQKTCYEEKCLSSDNAHIGMVTDHWSEIVQRYGTLIKSLSLKDTSKSIF